MRGQADIRARRWGVRLAVWASAALALVWAVVVWSPLALAEAASRGEVGDWCWLVDVCASLASQSVIGLVVLAGVAACLRRWGAAGVVLIAAVAVAVLPLSEPRLGRAGAGSAVVRVLTYNARTGSGAVEAKAALVQRADADVLVLLEPPLEWVEGYLAGGGGLDGYVSGWRPRGAWSGCPLLLSRHPVDEHGAALGAVRRRLWDHFYRLEIVRTPGGDVAVVQAHARSPRSAARWRVGLEQLLMVGDAVREIGEVTGLPVVVAGDFNSPATGLRARAFARRSGLVRAKPALIVAGTFPSWLPAQLGISIDDVYASPGVRVSSWEVVGSAGSDHRGLVVGLVVDQSLAESLP